MPTVDLNCDIGEAFGPWRMGNDAEIMKWVSSVNIACGAHAGDASTMRYTVDLAIEHGVAIGAHPGYPDLQGFGRRNMTLSPAEIYDQVLFQVAALKGICEARGAALHHVKPHGAMYNQSATDNSLAVAIVEAVRDIDASLIVYGLSGGLLISAAAAAGLRTASEVFADRTYQADGTLTPRAAENSLITKVAVSLDQAVQMVETQSVTTTNGVKVRVTPETICLHGDSGHGVEFAAAIRYEFDGRGMIVAAPYA